MKQNIENKARILGKGTWISLGSPIVTEVISMMQFDWLLFDLEHGFMQEHDILPNLMAVKSSGMKLNSVVDLLRVCWTGELQVL